MRETHVLLESVWERLVRAVKEGSKRPSKSLKGYKLRRTSNLTFLKSGHKLHTKKQWLRLSLRTIQYGTNTHKRYFYTFRINQITSIYGERKKERPSFYGMFRQSLLNSAAFTAILKMKLPQCNAIGVRTPPGRQHFSNWPEPCSHEGMFSSFVFLMKNVIKIHFIERTNLIAARIYSQATVAHWKKTDGFYSPWTKCCMRNEKRCVTCASKQLHNI